MRRPCLLSEAKAPASRERILRAAIEVMRAGGVGATTTRAIAANAGVSEALIYRYFKNKIDVLRTAVREQVTPEFWDVINALPAAGSSECPALTVQRIARAALRYYHDLVPLLAAVFSDSALIEWYRTSLIEHDAGPHRAIRIVGEYLAAEQCAGHLAPTLDPTAAAQMLLGACFQQVFFTFTVGVERLSFDDEHLVVAVAGNIAPNTLPGSRECTAISLK
jgi:AcrR family transcriptional regulator